jgi:osmoprotectant transport system substrate-binding protein
MTCWRAWNRVARRAGAPLVALSLAACVLAGCGATSTSSAASSRGGIIGKQYHLTGLHITVGSLDFTEELIMGWITVDTLRAAGATVTPKLDIAGVDTIRQAELSGDIGMYPSYTGTGWVVYLKQTSRITNPKLLFERLDSLDQRENGIAWIGPAKFNDTYDVATSERISAKYHVRTISELAALVRSDPAVTTFCATSSFEVRPDGLPGLEHTYGFHLPASDVKTEARGLIYTSLGKGSPCNFGETYSTDARLIANRLVVLDDNLSFFPLYNGAETVRASILRRYPTLGPLFDLVLGRLTTPVITQLNSEVDLKGMPAQEVASKWLATEGLT